jgi:regulator of replication initiation timing
LTETHTKGNIGIMTDTSNNINLDPQAIIQDLASQVSNLTLENSTLRVAVNTLREQLAQATAIPEVVEDEKAPSTKK